MSAKKSFMYLLILAFLTLAATLFFLDHFQKDPEVSEIEIAFSMENIDFSTSSGEKVSLLLEIADDSEKRMVGLMDRQKLNDIDGMLFVFSDDVEYGFWMKDTLIPLSIAFIDKNGIILEIIDMEVCPKSEGLQKEEDVSCPVYYPRERYRYAVEVAKGYFSEAGIGEGDRMDLPKT